jgi:acyl-CoA thioesterase FadM
VWPVSGISTRWVVLDQYPVTAAELDDEGRISDAAVERWVAAARDAYLDRCELLRHPGPGIALRSRTVTHPPAAALGGPDMVAVSASAAEVRPTSFTISVRVRPGGDEGAPLNVTCVIRLEDEATGEARPLGEEIRDELIALEHAAQHFN